ncbi:MAG: flippase [Chloroflexi bacterium]|nr:flippase [Chloroflexota bacterium]
MIGLRTIAKNIASLTVVRIATALLEFLFVVMLTRTLGETALGQYSFGLAFSFILASLIGPGFQIYIIKEVSRNRKLASIYSGNLLIIELLLFLVIFSVIIVIINVIHVSSDMKMIIYIFGFYAVIQAFVMLFRSVFHAFEKMEYSAILAIGEKIVIVSLGLIFMNLGFSLIAILSSYIIGSVINVILSYIISIKKFAKPEFRVDFVIWKRLPREALPLIFYNVFLNMYDRIDTLVIMVMVGTEATGLYNAAYRIINGLSIIPIVLCGALLPAFSRLYVTSLESLKALYEKSFTYLYMVVIPISIGMTLLSDRFIVLIYGDELAESSTVLNILLWMFLFNSGNLLLISLLQATDRLAAFARPVFFFTMFNIISSIIVIPWLDYEGAAMTTAIMAGLLFATLYRQVSQDIYKLSLTKVVLKPITAGTIMGIALYFTADILNLVLAILISIIIYFAVIAGLKGISPEDLQLFKRLITKTRTNT